MRFTVMDDVRGWLATAREIIAGMRIADAADIALAAVIAYALLSWLRKARSRFVAIGLCVVAVSYFVARSLAMHLSLSLFEAGLPALFIALLVIFQEDLRRGFERLALTGSHGFGRVSRESVDILVEVCGHLAQRRVGALIVVGGREPLERHLHGGVVLEGKLSAPLLYSLFDPGSPGHDGAVVVRGDSVRRFAVHLPLSTSSVRLHASTSGTRHAAALGLSERSDALVLVVSEERGAVSIACEGELRCIADGSRLAHELHAFRSLQAPLRGRSFRMSRPRTTGLLLKGAALLLATAAWFVLALEQRELVVRTLDLPVTYRNVPEDWLVEEPTPAKVAVTLSAPAPTLTGLDLGKLALAIDLSKVDAGAHWVEVGAQSLELPPDAVVQRVQPGFVRVAAHETEPVELPVQVTLHGTPASGRRLLAAHVEPDKVVLLVSRRAREGLTRVTTEPIELRDLTKDTSLQVGIVIPDGARLPPQQSGLVDVELAVGSMPSDS